VRVITLLTDFGTADYFVGAMKGVILSINPHAAIVDITHEIPAQNVAAGAFTLLAAYDVFPPGAIHVAVVDPGVGSERRPIVVSAADQFFVGPDNGIFSHIYDRHPQFEVFHITATNYFRHPVSNTFHGRDIFAPVAAALANEIDIASLGPRLSDPIRLPSTHAFRVIHIDRFGNCVTNITREVFPEGSGLLVNETVIRAFRRFYADSEGPEPFLIWGSAGFLEISMNGRSASTFLAVAEGDEVQITEL
jgi:S-adenosyl-L-methionine hydrolase (adenosine-forming)